MSRKPVNTPRVRGILADVMPRAGSAADTPMQRRDAMRRALVETYGDPLEVIAQTMATTGDAKLRADCARTLAPYMWPQLRAAEISGPEGGPVTVEVVKIASSAAPI